MPRSPSRTTGWSSTISSRIGAQRRSATRRCGRDRRHARRDRGAAARLGLDRERARQPAAPAAASRSGRSRRAGRPRRAAVGRDLEADAVVADVQRHHVPHVRQRQPDPGRAARAWPRWPAPPARSAAGPPRSPGAAAAASPVVVTSAVTPFSADQRCGHLGERLRQPARLQRARAATPAPTGAPR